MSNFETWWEREGQEFLYALNTTTDDDIKLVAEFAWKNGAYCAEQAEQEPYAYEIDLIMEGVDKVGYPFLTSDKAAIERLSGNKNYSLKPLYTHPVRTKDLTDEELNTLWHNTKGGWLGLFRAVIAADREKNR